MGNKVSPQMGEHVPLPRRARSQHFLESPPRPPATPSLPHHLHFPTWNTDIRMPPHFDQQTSAGHRELGSPNRTRCDARNPSKSRTGPNERSPKTLLQREQSHVQTTQRKELLQRLRKIENMGRKEQQEKPRPPATRVSNGRSPRHSSFVGTTKLPGRTNELPRQKCNAG